jgi:fructan beta-fructosidase
MQSGLLNRRQGRPRPTAIDDDVSPYCADTRPARQRVRYLGFILTILLCPLASLFGQNRVMHITRRYLNLPISRQTSQRLFTISADGSIKRQFPVQLADHVVDYWVFIDVTEFKGQTITLSGSATQAGFDRIYQADTIHSAATLYKESGRPQFHFTVKRGWSNDINGPIFYKGKYHIFWQDFPFGTLWDTGFMYWGHAVSSDLIHWQELPPAMGLDKLGSPWSGTALVDHNNDGGWGKDALVLVYTAFDRNTKKQVQCIAYSTDDGATFTRYAGNPILDSNREVGSNDTRDPKVFWYEPTKHWVMVLFEKDGMSFYTSTDLKTWAGKSHFKGLHECPDFFELPVDGDTNNKKWLLHGGSSSYFIGSFDGNTFTAESPELHYAEGKNAHGDDTLYAAQSFVNMPDGRRVQMAWGRIEEKDMPFNQMMLFPTEFKLTTTTDGLRLLATPIREIDKLHLREHAWSSLSAAAANRKLAGLPRGLLDVKAHVALQKDDALTIEYEGTNLATIHSRDLEEGHGSIELLIDKSVAEIFVDGGKRYIVREIPASTSTLGLTLSSGGSENILTSLQVYEMKSMWNGR